MLFADDFVGFSDSWERLQMLTDVYIDNVAVKEADISKSAFSKVVQK